MNLLHIMPCIPCIVSSYKLDTFYVGYATVEHISSIQGKEKTTVNVVIGFRHIQFSCREAQLCKQNLDSLRELILADLTIL